MAGMDICVTSGMVRFLVSLPSVVMETSVVMMPPSDWAESAAMAPDQVEAPASAGASTAAASAALSPNP